MSFLTNSNFLKIDFLYFNNFNYKIKMPWTKEQYKAYDQTENGKMRMKIRKWKKLGLIMDNPEDYLTIYYHWLCSTNCEKCNKEFTKGNTKYRKCMDHNHTTGQYRNILCNNCNCNDNSRNTSGTPNISWYKRYKKWIYKRNFDGKSYCKYFTLKEEAIAYKIEFESGGV